MIYFCNWASHFAIETILCLVSYLPGIVWIILSCEIQSHLMIRKVLKPEKFLSISLSKIWIIKRQDSFLLSKFLNKNYKEINYDSDSYHTQTNQNIYYIVFLDKVFGIGEAFPKILVGISLITVIGTGVINI